MKTVILNSFHIRWLSIISGSSLFKKAQLFLVVYDCFINKEQVKSSVIVTILSSDKVEDDRDTRTKIFHQNTVWRVGTIVSREEESKFIVIVYWLRKFNSFLLFLFFCERSFGLITFWHFVCLCPPGSIWRSRWRDPTGVSSEREDCDRHPLRQKRRLFLFFR